jgi:hypothetical protein
VDPELISILQIQFNVTLGNKQIDAEANTILEVSENVTNIDSNNADTDTDLKSVGVNISGDL